MMSDAIRDALRARGIDAVIDALIDASRDLASFNRLVCAMKVEIARLQEYERMHRGSCK
jgi:hypothetical protein